MKSISILGSTGSIGVQALEMIEANSHLFRLRAISCNRDIKAIEGQIEKFRPAIVCVYDDAAYNELKGRMPAGVELVTGMEGLVRIAEDEGTDILLTSVVGNIGLVPTVAAIRKSKRIALANKETLVTSGSLIMELARKHGAEIIPVDSEHSAIFQSLQGNSLSNIERVILTASGGPFRGMKRSDLIGVGPEKALKHPNWSMGRKITIDSSTLMNKGLEVIEARWLFEVDSSRIDVVIHPESIIHSMVEYCDSSIIAQMGLPDMKLPIHYAFTYPERVATSLKRIDFKQLTNLTFMTPDTETFPCLRLAYEALDAGGTMATVLNAANEVMVEKFLDGRTSFYGIPEAIGKMMESHDNIMDPTLDDILAVDMETRARAYRDF